ncbi:retrovirus-related pol polyprotein from transposon TNT 1-94 [Tanacetum coccineum]|uniref:Retrovirus-related pol polyprotein from transposon TNT 1-94 n=1 Tax=Tanacetum coccineum TaxID=301880 RepID=A0ABQ5IYL7_9ASTR
MPKVEKYVTESLGDEVLARSSNQPQTSYDAATSLLEFELKKILIDKIEENKSMNRSDIQKNLYNTLWKSYNSDKDLFASYGKEESSKEATQKESKSTSSSKVASRSQPKSSGKSAQAEGLTRVPRSFWSPEQLSTTCDAPGEHILETQTFGVLLVTNISEEDYCSKAGDPTIPGKLATLYDAFDKFAYIKGETLSQYYYRFAQLINDIHIYQMRLQQFQVNTKFLNSLPPEWRKFMTDVKLVKDLHVTNFDQVFAYLEHHVLGDDLLYYDAELELMNMILLAIPNEIYNSVDSCKTAKEMWARVELNTKFLNSLQPEWLKYVTQVRLAKRLTVDSFDDLFDYLSQFEKLVNASRAKKLEKSHDPLALVAHTGSSSRNTSSYYVTHPSSVVDYDEEYEQDDVHNHSEDPLASAMLLLAKAITQNFSNPTNNRLRASSNTRNQAVVQGDRVNIQSRNSGNVGRNNRRAYVQEEVVEGMNATNETANVQRIVRTPTPGNTSTGQCYNCGGKGHYARNCPKPRVRDSKYFMEQMLLAKQDEAGVILTDEQNDFLFADASRMEEIEELSANICLMARIQPADQNSNDEPSYESAFISEVQSSSINENDEQMYPTHTKIINSTIDDDQINSNIQFDSVKGNVNSGSVEKDTHVYDLCALETLARNAYDEAAKQQRFAQKVQQQNMTLTSQIEMYKERNRVLENITKDNNYLKEFLEADERAKRVQKQAESQLYRDRDIIRDLEKQRDKLSQEVKHFKQKNEELQQSHLILKRKMSENEDKYHDTILDLEEKLKKNVDLFLKIGNSLQAMFMLGPKPLSVYDQQLKHGLGYPNPYTLRQAISECPKLYVASRTGNIEIPLNVRDSEETLEDAFKSQQKMNPAATTTSGHLLRPAAAAGHHSAAAGKVFRRTFLASSRMLLVT